MEKITLSASARDLAVSPSAMRRAHSIPCILYGNKVENTPLACEEAALKRAYAKAGESTLVQLDVAGKTVPVLFHAVDFDPVSDRLTHVDFYAVDMNKELEAPIPLKFVGESLAVKDALGILVTPRNEVTVRCLPADLPHELEVDLSALAELHSAITVADIKLPKGVAVLDNPEEVVALIQEQRKEEEAPAAPAEGEAAAAGAEGAPAAEAGKEGAENEKKD